MRVTALGMLAGTVRFKGDAQFRPGVWVGIELDQPCASLPDLAIGSEPSAPRRRTRADPPPPLPHQTPPRVDGKNDGSVQGVRYFACASPHGIFTKASQVQPLTAEADAESAALSKGMMRCVARRPG